MSPTGAIRSADADELDFASMPLLGLLGVARTAHEGGQKYGRYNYLQGMPVHQSVNHALRHLIMYLLGDRSEPHLSHASWNCMNADQESVLRPEQNVMHLPGPGYTVSREMLLYLETGKAERKAKREAGVFRALADWCLAGLADVKQILRARRPGWTGITPVAETANDDAMFGIDGPSNAQIRHAHRTLAEARVHEWRKEEDNGVFLVDPPPPSNIS